MNRNLFSYKFSFFIIFLAFCFIFDFSVFCQDIRTANIAEYIGSGRYNWTVFLLADESTLDTIEYVEYILHPTFPDPIQRSYNRYTKFSFSAAGWGEFDISVTIVYKNGNRKILEHPLRLKGVSKETPYINQPLRSPEIGKRINNEYLELDLGESQRFGKISTGNTSRPLGRNRWEWTVFIVADEATLNDIACVQYILHPTFPNPINMICERGSGSGKGFFLKGTGWGTFPIDVEIIFKDGRRKYLQHPLRFTGH